MIVFAPKSFLSQVFPAECLRDHGGELELLFGRLFLVFEFWHEVDRLERLGTLLAVHVGDRRGRDGMSQVIRIRSERLQFIESHPLGQFPAGDPGQ